MNRELKFRVWDEAARIMYKTARVDLVTGEVWGWLEGTLPGRLSSPILQQFTGLCDKNGKEVYEGDIIRTDDRPGHLTGYIFKVFFREGQFTYANGEVPLKGITDAAEVIGNVYENPDLLESDHTPAAFSPPTTDGGDKEPLPGWNQFKKILSDPSEGSGEQPTTVEGHKLHFKGDTIDMKPYGDEQYNKGWEDGVARYIENLLPVEVAEERRQAKYQVLEDLLSWHDQWQTIHEEPFNWYGAVKAMLVMKEPQKPFHDLRGENNE